MDLKIKKYQEFFFIERSNILKYLSLITFICVSFWQIIRIFYGIDFTDDVFCLAISVNILKGQTPFIDEINLACLTSLILQPFYWVWYKLFDVEGIVLFSKILFIISKALLCGIFYKQFSKSISRNIIFLSMAFIMSLQIYGLQSISYNNFSGILIAISLIIFYGYVSEDTNSRASSRLLLFGFLVGITTLIYPPIILSYSLIAALLIGTRKLSLELKYYLYIVIGGLCSLLYLLILSIKNNFSLIDIMNSYNYASAFNLSNKNNFINLPFTLIKNNLFLIFVLILSNFTKKLYNNITLSFLIILPLITIFQSYSNEITKSVWMLMNWAILGWAFFLILPRTPFRENLFYYLWLPSMICSMIIASFTGNGMSGSVFGFWPAWIVTTIFYCDYVDHISTEVYNKWFINILSKCNILFMVLLMNINLLNFYREDNFLDLSERISNGPFKWISTTPQKQKFIDAIMSSLKKIDKTGCTISFYDRFPGGYLLSKCKISAPTAWLFQSKDYVPQLDRKWIINYYSENNNWPDYVVRLKNIFYSKSEIEKLIYLDNDDFNNHINKIYAKIEENDSFEILSKRGQ